MGDFLSGEFESFAKCEHHTLPVKYKWATPKPTLQAERDNKTVMILSAEMLSLLLFIRVSSFDY